MRHVYTDESGTSTREPVAFVAAIIVDPDKQLRKISEAIRLATDKMIPQEARDDFYFHSTDIFGKYKKQFGWDLEYCNMVMEEWLDIVADNDLCPVVAWWEKELQENRRASRQANQAAHALAYSIAIQSCDAVVRALYPNDVASVYAEEVPDMQDTLRRVLDKMRRGDAPPFEWFKPITNIMQGASFLKKEDTVFLQLSDAVAYAFMRYFHKKPGGVRLLHSLWGRPKFLVVPEPNRAPVGRYIVPPRNIDDSKLANELGSSMLYATLVPRTK